VVTTSGVIAAGQTITAHVSGSWGTTGVTAGLQWYGCPFVAPVGQSDCSVLTAGPEDFNALPGAKTSTLVLQEAYKAVYVAYRGTKPGYESDKVESSIIGGAPNYIPDVVPLGAVGASGTTGGQAHVGAKLTAVLPKWSRPISVLHEVWQTQACVPGSCDEHPAQWAAVSDEFGSTPAYTPTPADYASGGTAIRLAVTVSPSDGDPTVYSPEYVLGLGTVKVVTAPTLVATASTFGVKPGSYLPAGTGVVQWRTDATDNPGTIRARNAAADATHAIYADVTYSPAGYQPITTRLIAQKGTVYATEAITGTRLGDTLGLLLAHPYIDPVGLTHALHYQWYSNGIAITGATGATFKPSSGYVNHHIQVRITGTSSLYNDVTSTTPSTFVLAAGVFTTPSAPSVVVSGAGLMPGTLMTVTPAGDYGTTGITFKYQWQRSANSGANWSNIAGATSARYTPVAGDATLELRVIVTATKSGYTSLSATSLTQNVLYSPDLVNFTTPALVPTGGVAKVGALLTVSVGTWNTTGLTYKYAWYDGDSSATGTLIPGVTGTTWTPTPTAYGDDVTVKVTASRAGYASVSVDSTPVTVGLGSAPVDVVAPVITKVGSAYTVSPGSWNLDGLSFTYEWQLGGTPVSYRNSYAPQGSDHGLITVHITATRNGYADKVIVVNGPTVSPQSVAS
jgi:hypothetical protein